MIKSFVSTERGVLLFATDIYYNTVEKWIQQSHLGTEYGD